MVFDVKPAPPILFYKNAYFSAISSFMFPNVLEDQNCEYTSQQTLCCNTLEFK